MVNNQKYVRDKKTCYCILNVLIPLLTTSLHKHFWFIYSLSAFCIRVVTAPLRFTSVAKYKGEYCNGLPVPFALGMLRLPPVLPLWGAGWWLTHDCLAQVHRGEVFPFTSWVGKPFRLPSHSLASRSMYWLGCGHQSASANSLSHTDIGCLLIMA